MNSKDVQALLKAWANGDPLPVPGETVIVIDAENASSLSEEQTQAFARSAQEFRASNSSAAISPWVLPPC